ncbi:MAG: TIGR03905 family TSCPD domain-containing protein [Lachnospiraceae bacterium]|nr:TIGR03905 family TSCPD domain-containing protein [Lachnospiraceae bacterium]
MIYKTRGTCSTQIEVELDENHVIQKVAFTGGCNGNLKGISQLVTGMKAEDVIGRLEGTKCGFKNTSCPDQLSKALREAIAS